MEHKSGFVSIIGNPNVGKSTIVNKLMGLTMHATNAKAQTTRHRIFAILNDDAYQMILADTPGVLQPKYKLQESMLHAVEQSLQDADVFLIVVTPEEKSINHERLLAKIQDTGKTIVLAINKMDTSSQDKIIKSAKYWQEIVPKAKLLPMSATENFQLDSLKDLLVESLPEHPAFFDKDDISNKSTRFFIEEFIRESALEIYDQEIPYAMEVLVNTFKKTQKYFHIEADIIVERETQKGIIVGHKGNMIKRLGTTARRKIEEFLQDKIFLDLHVKVDKNWRKEESKLKKYGYLKK